MHKERRAWARLTLVVLVGGLVTFPGAEALAETTNTDDLTGFAIEATGVVDHVPVELSVDDSLGSEVMEEIAPGDPVEDVSTPIEETTDALKDTTDKAGNAVDDTTDKAGNAVDDTTDKAGNAVDDTTDKAGNAVDDTTDKAGNAVDDTTDKAGNAVDDTTDKAGNAVDDTTDKAGNAVDDTTIGTGDDTISLRVLLARKDAGGSDLASVVNGPATLLDSSEKVEEEGGSSSRGFALELPFGLGTLPLTGASVIAFALVSVGLMALGWMMTRRRGRRRRTARANDKGVAATNSLSK
jgi:LPXTG-motif cell wall-anchored protein